MDTTKGEMMKQLIESSLYGRGLFVVSSPEMVVRYNTCLDEIGQEPTRLEKFSIDGTGWSPEVANEKKKSKYLSHGAANYAIILTPKQRRMPVYYPFNSFTWHLMQQVFDRYMPQIVDITKDSALWLSLDPALTHYRSPLDLLMIESIGIDVLAINGLMDAAKEQRELVMRYNQPDETWFDGKFRDELLASLKTYGDLRYRSLVIPSINFNDTRTFYTRAFGGVYVIRDIMFSGRQAMMVLEDDNLAKQLGTSMNFLFSASDPQLVQLLLEENLLVNDLGYYRENHDLLEIKLESIMVETLACERPDVDYALLTTGQKKRQAEELESKLPEEFFQLERMGVMLKNGRTPPSLEISPELNKYVAYPRVDLSQSVREVLYHLLSNICPLDLFTLYAYNKRKFFKDYRNWPQGKREWAVEMISERYRPRMERG